MNTDDYATALRQHGDQWKAARIAERKTAVIVADMVRDGARAGIPETELARLAQCDRMTIRRMLGK